MANKKIDVLEEESKNIETLREVTIDLKVDFKEARELRLENDFKDSDKNYFMTRSKQAEGIISATKNLLENIREIKKDEPRSTYEE